MNLFTRNCPYFHLLKYLLFLLKHPVYLYKLTSGVLLYKEFSIFKTASTYWPQYKNKKLMTAFVRGCKDGGGSSMIIVARLLNRAAKFKNTLDLRKLQNADAHERASQHELHNLPWCQAWLCTKYGNDKGENKRKSEKCWKSEYSPRLHKFSKKKKTRSIFKTRCARRVTWSKFHTADP